MTTALEVKDLQITAGNLTILRDVSLTLPESSFMAILGPNGGGKTTFILAVLGLMGLSSGTIEVFGKSPNRKTSRSIGYVPQVKSLDRRFPAMAKELVASGLDGNWPWFLSGAKQAACMEALERVGMKGKETSQLAALSGGELQRVYLARIFVKKPRLLVLDEPATGIDATGESDLYGILERYRIESGATIIMVTHDFEVAFHHASHVLMLNRKVEAFGPPSEVLTEEHLRRAFGHVGHAHPMLVPGRCHHV